MLKEPHCRDRCLGFSLCNAYHVLCDLILCIQFLDVFFRSLLLGVSSQVSFNKVVDNVVLSHTLDVKSTLEWKNEQRVGWRQVDGKKKNVD